MPTAVPTMASNKRQPTIAEPVQIASTSLLGQQGKGKGVVHLPVSSDCCSSTCHDALSLGSVYRLASKGTLKRSKALAAYVTRDSGVVVVDVDAQAVSSSCSFSTSLQPVTPPLVLYAGAHQLILIVLQARTEDATTELYAFAEEKSTSGAAVEASIGGIKKPHVVQVPTDVVALYALSAHEVLAQRRNGGLSIISLANIQAPQLAVTSATWAGEGNANVVFASVFDQTSMKYILHDEHVQRPSLAFFVQVTATSSNSEKSTRSGGRKGRKSAIEVIDAVEGVRSSASEHGVKLSFFAIEQVADRLAEQRIRKVGEMDLLDINVNSIPTISLHASGRLAMLSATGKLTHVRLSCNDDGSPLLANASTIQLVGIDESSSSCTSSVLAVSPTTVLVASLAGQQLSTLLLDVELEAVLAEHRWRAPSEECGTLYLHRNGGSGAIVLVGPTSITQGKASAYLWHLPYEASEGNHLRWSLTKRDITKRWIAQQSSLGESARVDTLRSSREQLLHEMRTLSQEGKGEKSAKAMEKKFTQWYTAQKSLLDHQQHTAYDEGGEDDTVQTSRAILLPASFVTEVMSIVLSDASEARSAYPSAIVKTMLEGKALRNANVASRRLLKALNERGDEAAVQLALTCVDDLSEDDVVDLVRDVAERTAADDDEPALRAILWRVAALHLSSEELRRAMKNTLNSEHVEKMLVVLQNWLAPDAAQPLLRPSSEDDNDGGAEQSKPTLYDALSLAIDTMDTFFPLILSTPSMQEPVRQLSTSVQAHIATLSSLGALRAPLTAFAKVEEDLQREADALLADTLAMLGGGDEDGEEREKYGDDDNGDGDSEDDEDRQTRRIWHAAKGGRQAAGGKAARPHGGGAANATMQIGGGVQARSGQREKTKRQQSFADRISVGLYALERFEP